MMNRQIKRLIVSPLTLSGAALALGIAIMVLALYVSNPYTKTFGPLTVVGAILGAVAYRQSVDVELPTVPGAAVLGGYLVTFVATFVLYVGAGYTRPMLVHVALLVLYLFAVLAIVSGLSAVEQLGLVVVTGVFHRALVYYASASQIGNDAVFHVRQADLIASAGDLSPLAAAGSKYWFMPFHHLLTASTSLVLGVPGRTAAFFSVTVLTTLVPILVVYVLASSIWRHQIATLAAVLYLIADRATAMAIHATPMSHSLVLFAALFLVGYRYLDTGSNGSLALFFVLLIGHVLNHPLGLLVSTVILGTYVATNTVWLGEFDRRGAVLVLLMCVAGLVQTQIVPYGGPDAETSILQRFAQNLSELLAGGTGRGSYAPPPSAEFVLGSSNALSFVHTIGAALLVCLGIIGGIVWIGRTTGTMRRKGICLCSAIAGTAFLVFSLPVVGIDLFFPYRWLGFLYVPVAVVAAVGLIRLLSAVVTGRNAVPLVLALLVITAPYTAFMLWNNVGSMDDPVFDESHAAQRLGTTPTEDATYGYVSTYGDGRPAVGDLLAANAIERGHGYPALTYRYRYESRTPKFDSERLIVDRAYAHTKHASYHVRYRDRWIRVFGPLPQTRHELSRSYSVVYTAGPDRVLYRPGSGEGTD